MSLPKLWFEKFRWPKAGSELVFVADAALRVGDALYKPGWTTDPSKAQISTIAAWIGDRCRDGLLGTRLLRRIGNKLVDGKTSDWLGNNDDHIIRNGFIEVLPKVAGDPVGCPVFIVREDLEAALAPLPNAGAVISVGDLSRYSDHLQFAVGLAKKWDFHRGYKPPKHEVLTDDVLKEWNSTRTWELKRDAASRIAYLLKQFRPD